MFHQQFFCQNRKELGIVLHLVALILFRSGSHALQPVFRVEVFRAVCNGQLQQFLGNAKGNLMSETIAQRQINRNQARRTQSAQHIFLLKQNDLFAFPGSSQSRGNSGKSTAAYRNIIVFCHRITSVLSILQPT